MHSCYQNYLLTITCTGHSNNNGSYLEIWTGIYVMSFYAMNNDIDFEKSILVSLDRDSYSGNEHSNVVEKLLFYVSYHVSHIVVR